MSIFYWVHHAATPHIYSQLTTKTSKNSFRFSPNSFHWLAFLSSWSKLDSTQFLSWFTQIIAASPLAWPPAFKAIASERVKLSRSTSLEWNFWRRLFRTTHTPMTTIPMTSKRLSGAQIAVTGNSSSFLKLPFEGFVDELHGSLFGLPSWKRGLPLYATGNEHWWKTRSYKVVIWFERI